MRRSRIYMWYMLVFILSFLLPLGANANAQVAVRTRTSFDLRQGSTDFPVVDPIYIYNQLAYTTSNFQARQAGYTANTGHDQFAAYWSREMVKNLQGFGPQ